MCLKEENETNKNIIRCSVNGCRSGFHAECRKNVGEMAGMDSGAEVCASHYCYRCKETFQMDESVARCIRCFKAVHAWK